MERWRAVNSSPKDAQSSCCSGAIYTTWIQDSSTSELDTSDRQRTRNRSADLSKHWEHQHTVIKSDSKKEDHSLSCHYRRNQIEATLEKITILNLSIIQKNTSRKLKALSFHSVFFFELYCYYLVISIPHFNFSKFIVQVNNRGSYCFIR
jgi:hypothetical protein